MKGVKAKSFRLGYLRLVDEPGIQRLPLRIVREAHLSRAARHAVEF